MKQEPYRQTAAVGSDGAYAFADVPVVAGRIYGATVAYADVLYFSAGAHLAGDGAPLDLPITIHETTTDATSLSIERLHLLFDFSIPDLVQVLELWVLSNSSDRTIVAAPGGGAFEVALPEGCLRSRVRGRVDRRPLRANRKRLRGHAAGDPRDSEDELGDLIDSGEARVGLIIPPGYTDQIKSNGSAAVMFVLDGSDPTVASTALSAAQLIGQPHATQILVERLERSAQASELVQPVEVHTRIWYNPDLISSYFMIPGVIAMILFFLTTILTATAVVRERERGTIEQLIVTPIRPWELVVGKVLPYVILAFLNMLEVLAIGHFWFGVPVRGSLILILGLSGLFLLTSLGIGLMASTVANTQQEAMLTIVLDLFSRRIVGWAMHANLTKELVLEALEMALAERRP